MRDERERETETEREKREREREREREVDERVNREERGQKGRGNRG